MSVFHALSGGKIVQAVPAGVAVGAGVRVGEGAAVGVDVGGVAVGGGGGVGVAVGGGGGVGVRVGVRVGVGLRRASAGAGNPSWRSSPMAAATKTEASLCRSVMLQLQSKFGTGDAAERRP